MAPFDHSGCWQWQQPDNHSATTEKDLRTPDLAAIDLHAQSRIEQMHFLFKVTLWKVAHTRQPTSFNNIARPRLELSTVACSI